VNQVWNSFCLDRSMHAPVQPYIRFNWNDWNFWDASRQSIKLSM
jgi:hypothetical protein